MVRADCGRRRTRGRPGAVELGPFLATTRQRRMPALPPDVRGLRKAGVVPATPQRHSAPQREACFSRPPFFVYCIASRFWSGRSGESFSRMVLGGACGGTSDVGCRRRCRWLPGYVLMLWGAGGAGLRALGRFGARVTSVSGPRFSAVGRADGAGAGAAAPVLFGGAGGMARFVRRA